MNSIGQRPLFEIDNNKEHLDKMLFNSNVQHLI